MNYRGFFWVLVVIVLIGLLLVAVVYKTRHPQPVYERYLGCSEELVAERVA